MEGLKEVKSQGVPNLMVDEREFIDKAFLGVSGKGRVMEIYTH